MDLAFVSQETIGGYYRQGLAQGPLVLRRYLDPAGNGKGSAEGNRSKESQTETTQVVAIYWIAEAQWRSDVVSDNHAEVALMNFYSLNRGDGALILLHFIGGLFYQRYVMLLTVFDVNN